ncbi:hypothetical protein BH11PLA2_BH11PLA2_11830 [soil metagenome]
MDGHWIASLALIAAVSAVGCRNTPKQTSNMPTPSNGSSMIERMMAPKPANAPNPSSVPVETAVERPKGPLKTETVATFADLQVEAAFSNEELSSAERDRRLDDARQKLQSALQTDPKNLEALRGLGRLYTRVGDRERATQTYTVALQHHPKNHQLIHEAALSAGRFENWDRAVSLWQSALALDPDSRKYPRMIGLAYARLGKFDESFNMMMKVMPEAETRLVMARELMEIGQEAACRQQIELAVKADPKFEPAVNALQQMNGVQQTGFQQ